ncbi:MAG: carotenoid biosynthesis protein [Acidobacteria bacterium]|nr:carotenoid biosynthesis protein [Acidobacteriota bacterium]
MWHSLQLLFSTIAFRPYVFVFLAFYLAIAITNIGWKRTAVYTVLAYALAWLSEWSSAVADFGIPFGTYKYINTTSDRELWLAGVPFMDSLSFSFLSYLSWEVAILLLGKLKISRRDFEIVNWETIRHSWPVTLLAAFLMTYLDIIIDPLTIQGEKWFLGKLYFYPQGGTYFGITLMNFVGWFVLCVVILRLYGWLERHWLTGWSWRGVQSYAFKRLFALPLYGGVIGFNLFMTFWIGDLQLAVTDIFITLPLAIMLAITFWRARGAAHSN